MAVFYDIVPLSVTVDDETDYVGKAKMQSAGIDEVAQRVMQAGCEYTKATLIAVFSLMEEAIRDMVAQGLSVTVDNAVFTPTIKGLFTKKGNWDSKVNRLTCTVSASKAFKEELESIEGEFTGRVNSTGSAAISLVEDIATGKSDGTITPGGIIKVTGRKIKCVAEDGESLGAIEFLDSQSGEVAADVTTAAQNTCGTLAFVCPALEQGSYVLQLRTHYSTGKLLKNQRVIRSDTLTVTS